MTSRHYDTHGRHVRPALLYVQRVISSSAYCSGVCTQRLGQHIAVEYVPAPGFLQWPNLIAWRRPDAILHRRGGSALYEANLGSEAVFIVRLLRDTDTISLASVTPPSRACPCVCWSCMLAISLVVP